MRYLKKNRTTRASIPLVSALAAMGLAGCEGELIQDGSVPDNQASDSYQLRYLPQRVSPDLPKTVFKGSELTVALPESEGVSEEEKPFSSRMDDIDSGKSEGWLEMNDDLYIASLMRLNVEINATIIDLALDDIQFQCEDQPIDCTIPADQITVQFSKNVINRMIDTGTDWAETIPPNALGEGVDAATIISEQFTALLDGEVVLGETRYSQLDGAPYDYSVQTILKRGTTLSEQFDILPWEGEQFGARWNYNGNVAKFVTASADSPTLEYFYQDSIPSEIVIASYVSEEDDGQSISSHVKLIANDWNTAGVLVEVASVVSGSPGGLAVDNEPSVSVNHDLFQGRMDNGGGYSTNDDILFSISDTPKVVVYGGTRETFDNVGNLIAGTECYVADFDQGVEVCDEADFVPTSPVGSSISDSPYYFQPGDFDSLVAVQDVIRWTVEGLPADVKSVAVVSANSGIEPSERELLCRGFRLVRDDTRLFCSATDEQLDNTLVLELVAGRPGRILPTATLVAVQ